MNSQNQTGHSLNAADRSKGGQNSHGSSGNQASGNNFKDNPEKAREAGRKGGEHSHSGRHSDDE